MTTVNTNTKAANEINKTPHQRKNCYTCGKIGNIVRFKECWICGNNSHQKCVSGELGCKKCLTNIYPAYEISSYRYLYSLHSENNLIFNPFDLNNDIHYIGEPIEDDNNFEHAGWVTCSNILNSCKYYEPREISTSRENELKIFSLNIRSLSNKISEIRENISHYSKFDILCFNETNCDPDKLPFGGNELELENFYNPWVQKPARLSGKGGGLAIYINKKFCAQTEITLKTNLSDNSNWEQGEFLTIEINLKNRRNIILCNMYRSPSGNLTLFMDKLGGTLQLLSQQRNKHIVFVSDSNVDLLKYGDFSGATQLVDRFSEYGFVPTISKPTRITDHTISLIDHIFTNNCQAITKSGVVTETLSDHLAVFVTVLLDPNKVNCKLQEDELQQENYVINDTNLANFKHEITTTDWSFLTELHSADDKFDSFEKKYRESYERNFPKKLKTPQKRKTDKVWILPWLQCACDRKNKMYRKFIDNPTIENKMKYRKLKKFVEKHVKLAKRRYYSAYFKKYSNDSRKQWQMVNNLLNRKTKKKTSIKNLQYKNENFTDPQEIANKFNEYFCNIAQELKDENVGLHGGRPPDLTISSVNRAQAAMISEDCTTEEISNIIQSLKNKATSDLGIMPLKYVSAEMSPVLNDIISCSLRQGIFPQKLKRAKVVPIHKGGNRIDVTNYRPISLLSCFSKIYEKVMHARLTGHLKIDNIMYASQYGFRSGHSCEHALLEAQNKILRSLEKKQITALLLLDFSKAFDMVDHGILLSKLEHYGVRGENLSWFKSYLTGRVQYTHINSRDSVTCELKYGVPQGSVLGPTLFILYINDLPNVSKLADYIFFADDANLIITANSSDELCAKVNSLLNKVQNWVASNGLKLNAGKTKYMIFSNRATDDINVSVGGVRLKQSEKERFLGVIIDSKLNWNDHIRQLATKISRNSGILYKLKGLVPGKTLKMLYNSFIQSHLNYCSTVWGLKSNNSLNALFRAQKKAIRATDEKFQNYFYDKNTGKTPSHTKEIFNRLKLLTVYNIIGKNCLTMMHKVNMTVTPSQTSGMFKIINRKKPRRELEVFEIPLFRLRQTDNTLPYKGPKLYNTIVNKINSTLPHDVSQVQNKFLNSFKSTVTKYLLQLEKEGDDLNWEPTKNFVL